MRTVCWNCLEFAGQVFIDKLNAPAPNRWVVVPANVDCGFCWLFVKIGE